MEKKEGKAFVPYKEWLHQHDGDIRREFPDRPTGDLAGEYDVNYYTVSRRATRLGVGKSEPFMHTSWRKGQKGKRGRRTKYAEASDAYMREHFADTGNAELARHFGVDVKTVRRWARRLGLQKTKAFMDASRAKARDRHAYYTPEHREWRIRRISEVFPDAGEEQLRALAAELGISVKSLRLLAWEAGVRRSPERLAEAARRRGRKSRKYDDETLAAMAAWYPTHPNAECAERFSVTPGVISQLAVKHGWKKDREYLTRLRSEINRRRNRKGDVTA